MILPNFTKSLQYYVEGKVFYKKPLLYGFKLVDNQIYPATADKSLKYELYSLQYMPFYKNTIILYLFPDIPNEQEYNKLFKDFLYKLKLDRINDDFT